MDKSKCSKIKQVIHYQYDSWLDTFQPSNIQSFNNLVAIAMTKLSDKRVVHCSAGVGRTGQFIACCYYYQRIILNGERLVTTIKTELPVRLQHPVVRQVQAVTPGETRNMNA